MTGSRVSRLAYALALAVFAAPLSAQWSSDKPPVLGPDDYPPIADDEDASSATEQDLAQPSSGATGTPRPLQGKTDVKSLPPPPAPPPARTVQTTAPTIEVGALGSPEGGPVGTLDLSNGGLGGNMWTGSDRAKAEDLLAHAPLNSGDPTLRAIMKQIVLTKASSPVGTARRAFIAVRIDKLLEAGLIEEAGEIAAQASVPNDEDFARVQANALLIANRAGDACGDATAARLSSGGVFWMQLRAYCAAAGGDQPTADLTRAVLKAQGHNDAVYDTLMDDVLNHKTVLPAVFPHPTAMYVFLLQRAGLPIPGALARGLGTSENLLAMRDTRNTPRVRFEAAERIIQTGAARIAELKQIADAQDLPLSRVADAATDAPNLPFFMGQVLLRRAASIEPRPEEKARLVSLALSLGDRAGQLPLAAALQADAMTTIRLAPPDRDLSRLFARALLLAKRPDAAAPWTNGDAVMRSIVALASQDQARAAASQADLVAFAQALTKNPPDADPDRSCKALVLAMSDVLGRPMPSNVKTQTDSIAVQKWDGKRPDAAAMRAIEEAALHPERRGEALLMILDTIRDIGLRDLAPDTTVEFVRLVSSMVDPQAARSLAIDALAQYRPPPRAPTAVMQ